MTIIIPGLAISAIMPVCAVQHIFKLSYTAITLEANVNLLFVG